MECGICLEKFPNDVMEFMPCFHSVCSFCYKNLKILKCPYCRTSFENSLDSDLDDEVYFQMIPIEEDKKRRKKKKKNRRKIVRENATYNLSTTTQLNRFEVLG